jgi:basic membrane protein A
VRKTLSMAVSAAVVLSLTIAAGAGAGPAKHNAAGAFKMAIVTDIGSLQDRSFNQLANEGRIAVTKQLGIETRAYETKSEAERIPNAISAARGHNLVFMVGFLNYTATNAVAPRFPKVSFVGIDEDYSLFKSKPKNATGVIFAEQEAGFLVGYLAALQVKSQGGRQVISAVGANNVPAIVRFISGYIQGAKKANPRITVLANYANDPTFSDQAKCKETALGQLAKGSRAVFQVAGGCGLGALAAAKEKGAWGIGVDADQLYLGSHMLTSALKYVNVAVQDLTNLANAGNLRGGSNFNYNLKNKGVGLGSVNKKVKKAFITKTQAIGKQIAAGKIVVKPSVKF